MEEHENLRGKVVSGVIWKFAEQLSAQMVTFVVSVILARLLSPTDYGKIALVNVFILLANTFVESGFGSALIQKKDADNVDFSTVFYFSIALSAAFYLLLFLAAPAIASFYQIPELCAVLRVLALQLPISAVKSVESAYISRQMQFKRFFFATIGGTAVSAVVGIVMALSGFGLWALVAQYLTNAFIDTVVLWFTAHWRPDRVFSVQRLKGLYSYGWKLLCGSLICNFYEQFRNLVIGKFYSSADLAFYNKGQQFPQVIVSNINSSITTAMFPAIAKVQDDKARVKQQVRHIVRISSYIMWPAMLGLAAVATPLIRLLLTEKWLPCVVFMRLICIQWALLPVQQANLQSIRAIGRSDLTLKMEIIKRSVSLLLVLLTMRISVLAIALGGIVETLFSTLVNTYPNRKLLNYSYREQMSDLIQPILLSVSMAVPVYLVGLLPLHDIAMLLMQVSVGIAIYVGESVLFHVESFYVILDILRPYLSKFRKSRPS